MDAKLGGEDGRILEWTRGRDKRRRSTVRVPELSVSVVVAAGVETHESPDGPNVDLESTGDVVGFDIDHAARRLDLSTPEMEALPLPQFSVGCSVALGFFGIRWARNGR